MSKQQLRNSSGTLIGTIETKHDGKLELRNASGTFVGTYDPKTNQTRDKSGTLVGTGNVLTTLL